MTTGERIKNIRKQKGLTQHELGELLGVTQSMIAAYENNTRNPKPETLQKIANALEVPLYKFFDWADGLEVLIEKENERRKQWAELDNIALIVLNNIYNKVEEGCEELEYMVENEKVVLTIPYYIIGDGSDKFFLFDEDVEKINALIETSTKNYADMLKTESGRPKSEEQIYDELLMTSKDPEHINQTKEHLKKYSIVATSCNDDSEINEKTSKINPSAEEQQEE